MKKKSLVLFLLILLAASAFIVSGCNKKIEIKEPATIVVPESETVVYTDLFVYGTEPEGIAAAVRAAEASLKYCWLIQEKSLEAFLH